MSNKKPIVLTRAVEQEMYHKFLVLTLAYFMELGAFAKTDIQDRPIFHTNAIGEKVYDTDIQKLKDAYTGLNDWLKAVNDHTININLVSQVVEDRLNDKLRVKVD